MRSLSRARSRSAQIHKRARTDASAVGAGGRTRASGCPTGPGCFWALCSTKSRRKPILHSHGRVPGHQGVRFSQVVVGGFSPVGESALTGRQAQSAPKVCPDSLLQAKPWRLMPKTPHPVARWWSIGFLWPSKVFTRVFFEAFAASACPCRALGRNIPVSIFSFAKLAQVGGSPYP